MCNYGFEPLRLLGHIVTRTGQKRAMDTFRNVFMRIGTQYQLTCQLIVSCLRNLYLSPKFTVDSYLRKKTEGPPVSKSRIFGAIPYFWWLLPYIVHSRGFLFVFSSGLIYINHIVLKTWSGAYDNKHLRSFSRYMDV